MKWAVIGGGSRFVVNIAHGLEIVLPGSAPGAYEIALFDLDRPRVEKTARYCRAAVARRGLPATFTIAETREQALAGASHVLVSIGLHEADGASHRAIEKYRFPRHSVHDGPTAIATALEAAPVFLELARAMRAACPDALMINLVNPTDVLADLVSRATGVRAVGLCVEVPLWLDCLAHYLGEDFRRMHAVHGGINHEGWIKSLRVGGPAGRVVGREELLGLAGHPGMHLLNRGALMVYELTGVLPSSGGHYWQYSDYELPGGQEFWNVRYRARRAPADERAKAAYDSARPLEDVRSGHPITDAPFSFMSLGIALAEWLQAVETGTPARLAVQVPNDGPYVTNWPREVWVEVPARVEGLRLTPEAVGDLPDAPCVLTKLLGIQRQRTVDFVLDGSIASAREALAATPHLATVQNQLAFAEELVARRKELAGKLALA